MSRRTAVIEDFDDDTDLPLPSRPLPNTGTRGAILEALTDDEDDGSDAAAGPATLSNQALAKGRVPGTGKDGDTAKVTDLTPYKKWTCIYPIYIDAKRPYGTGERRVPRAKALWWPLSKDIADAANRLGLGTLHEVQKLHPRDWENPGRVKVQWKKDGRLVNPNIKTKKQLLELISMQIQMQKPENAPKEPYSTIVSESQPPALPAPASAKGKQPASKTAGKGTTALSPAAIASNSPGRQLPVPPAPHPPLANRVSPYSPALVSGVLVEAVKAGMSSSDGGLGALGGGGGGGKGKKKVIRVRG